MAVTVAMMVRDESARVARALQGVLPFVDRWVVVDTGSVDDTVERITAVTAGSVGELHRRPWVDFAHNRNELLSLVGGRVGDWVLTIDADHEVLQAEMIRSLVIEAHTSGCGALLLPFEAEPKVWVTRLFRADLPWRYVGATREFLACDVAVVRRRVDAPVIRDWADGASRAVKWERDIRVLREVVAADPDDARSWFYLGESLRGAGNLSGAGAAYTNCAVKTSSGEERYVALVMSAEMAFATGRPAEGLARLLLANEGRPQRREALLMACQVLNQQGRHGEVSALLADGVERDMPAGDILAIIPGAYGAAMRLEFEQAHRALN